MKIGDDPKNVLIWCTYLYVGTTYSIIGSFIEKIEDIEDMLQKQSGYISVLMVI